MVSYRVLCSNSNDYTTDTPHGVKRFSDNVDDWYSPSMYFLRSPKQSTLKRSGPFDFINLVWFNPQDNTEGYHRVWRTPAEILADYDNSISRVRQVSRQVLNGQDRSKAWYGYPHDANFQKADVAANILNIVIRAATWETGEERTTQFRNLAREAGFEPNEEEMDEE